MSDAKIKISVEDQQAITALNKLGNSFTSVGSKASVGMNQASTATEKAGGSAQLMGSRLSKTIKSFIAFEFAKKIVQTADATMRAAETMEGLSAATYKSAASYVELSTQAKASFDQILLGISPFMETLAGYAAEGLAYWAQVFGVDPEANRRALVAAQQQRMNLEADLKLYSKNRAEIVKKMNDASENYDKIIFQQELDDLDFANKERLSRVEAARKAEADAKAKLGEDELAQKKALDKKNEAANKAAADKRKAERQKAKDVEFEELMKWGQQFIATQEAIAEADKKANDAKFDYNDKLAEQNKAANEVDEQEQLASRRRRFENEKYWADNTASLESEYLDLKAQNSEDVFAIEQRRYDKEIAILEDRHATEIQLNEKTLEHTKSVAELKRKEFEDIGAATAQLFGSIASLIADGDMKDKQRRLQYKTAAIAEIAINTAVGFTKALAMEGPVGIITGGAVLISGAAQAKRVESQKFATGGIVQGPSAGDQVPVRANGGEMVITKQQQAELFKIANGNGGGGVTVHYSPVITGGNSVAMRQMLQENHAEFARYVKAVIADPSIGRQQRAL